VTIALVVAGAVIGAPLRYLAGLVMQGRHDSVFPWGSASMITALLRHCDGKR
jgi:CrcB protein